MAKIYTRGSSGDVGFNMTPLVDCTFQLMIFFLLTSQMASEALAPMELPVPYESQALPSEKMKVRNRVIVNVLSAHPAQATPDRAVKGQASEYRIGMTRININDADRLVPILKSRKADAMAAGAKDFFVEIRADHRVNYGEVEPVISAAVEAEIPKMNITARIGE